MTVIIEVTCDDIHDTSRCIMSETEFNHLVQHYRELSDYAFCDFSVKRVNKRLAVIKVFY